MRVRILLSMAAASCVAAACWSAAALASARHASERAVEDLSRVRVLVTRIATLRDQHAPTTPTASREADLSARIESAAAAAGLSQEQLLRIEPLPRVREVQGDGDYVLTPTRIEIASAPLDRLLMAAHKLLTDDPALRLTAARFSLQEADTGQAAPALWDCELTLTRREYLPN